MDQSTTNNPPPQLTEADVDRITFAASVAEVMSHLRYTNVEINEIIATSFERMGAPGFAALIRKRGHVVLAAVLAEHLNPLEPEDGNESF